MALNKNRNAHQIRCDRYLETKQQEFITDAGRRTVTFTCTDDDVGTSGESNLVRTAEDNQDMTIRELKLFMKSMGEPINGDDLAYANTHSRTIPPMRYAIDGPHWDLPNARAQMVEYCTIEGYGDGGHLSYKDNEPKWWPDSIDYKTWYKRFKHPGSANIGHLKLMLKAFLHYHGKNEDFHNEELIEPPVSKKKPKRRQNIKKKKSQPRVDDTLEEVEDVNIVPDSGLDGNGNTTNRSLSDDGSSLHASVSGALAADSAPLPDPETPSSPLSRSSAPAPTPETPPEAHSVLTSIESSDSDTDQESEYSKLQSQNINIMKEKLIELNMQEAVNESKVPKRSRKRKLPAPAATRKSSRLAAASRAEDRQMSPSGGGETSDQSAQAPAGPPTAEQPRAEQPTAGPPTARKPPAGGGLAMLGGYGSSSDDSDS